VSLVAVLAAYLVGAVPIGWLVARRFGVADIRQHGSGNIGATNVLRTAGRLPAIVTLVGDIAKGYDSPIIHVNADDAEATVAAIRTAVDRLAADRALKDVAIGVDVDPQ